MNTTSLLIPSTWLRIVKKSRQGSTDCYEYSETIIQ
jgi:hypothetical protein